VGSFDAPPPALFVVKLRTFVSAEGLRRRPPSKPGRCSSGSADGDDITRRHHQRAVPRQGGKESCGWRVRKNSWTFGKRGNSERADVTQENYGGRGWGIGVGLVLGIILALLSLLRLPFVGGRGLRSAAAAKTSSETVDDRLGERPLPNSGERDARNLPKPDLDWPKTAVQ